MVARLASDRVSRATRPHRVVFVQPGGNRCASPLASAILAAFELEVREAKVSVEKTAKKRGAAGRPTDDDRGGGRLGTGNGRATAARAGRTQMPTLPATGGAAASEAIEMGAAAPQFALVDQHGNRITSRGLRGTSYLLFFYPKDDTSGCTREACDYRDEATRIGALGVRLFGVSPDSEASHKRFAEKHELPFSLLVDGDRELARAYGVWVKKKNYGREYMGVERSTFLIDATGRVRRQWRKVKVAGHVRAVVGELLELQG